ncbi:cellulase family glycosylhydrolase [Cellulomonas bogoriensis]|uniref:cellulase family glycosylhydrolase n=1 Tax=Cellulomonas bogoriensis TaxID=301388 RepID=UPI000556DF6A|nr:cellulase family glycosylhydrolase [Cellulomonas bogoriensis]
MSHPSTRRPARGWAAAVCALLLAPAVAAVGPTTAHASPGADWLTTDGNQIVDSTGNPVWLTGTNWFGFNTSERVFHGLWSANITEVTRSMAERGMNIIRVPISTELLLEWRAGQAAPASGVNTFANPELEGMTTLEVFDYFLELCQTYGLKVMLDVHSAEADNSGHIAPLWYKGSITPEDFFSTWEWVAERYKDNDTLLAYDLQNEPHGQPGEPRAKWDDSTDVDNWKHAAETAAERILAINPDALILVEGIEVYPKEGQTWDSPRVNAQNEGNYYNYWWGGNLRGVRDHPVQVSAHQEQIMYSPHDYGPLVHEQPWFRGEFDKESLTRDVWGPNWLYLHDEGVSPLLMGEWGGRLGQDPRQDKWMFALRDLMIEKRIHHTFWVLNPNSGDTGGLLLDDWATWDEEKYAMLEPALWQHDGKFVGLDRQVPLGGHGSTTGISLGQYLGEATTDPAPTDPVPTDPPTEPEPTDPPTDPGPTDPGTTDTELTVRYRDASSSPTSGSINPVLDVVNSGTKTVDLSTVTVRYWFTRDGGPSSFTTWCDWAAVGCADLDLRVVTLPTPVTGADAYLEVSFTAGTLAPGASTGDLQLRIHKSDWSPFDQSDDHSRAAGPGMGANAHITAYDAGALVWGSPPA